ncbi:N-carbamoyl-D-amino-acid hydrolase [Labrenzia sp. 011]|uniref:N-carbamoyl-D-amino-acid hydrolase n=1 Tax=Labrenzia sp. 011 TaxID=2171494 RepID=UPI000D518364|nr:N-carbamoyl-D-amino-acid hydrolase [Labrenzia sp. 011]PVB60455.1 N-carbamoyl-D-amino-acid hydrolase [Labrenzia sp. 011]
MSRSLMIAAAQMGPILRTESRTAVVRRMILLMEKAAARGAELVVFPELALTSFFPRWYLEDQDEIDTFFESRMPSEETLPLFDAAARLGLSFSFGYAEKIRARDGKTRRFNTSVVVSAEGEILLKYRKIHLPGHREAEDWRPFQHLEKRYFEVGNLGFPVTDALGGRIGMCICNDRRWPETFRILGLQKAELVLTGYNTPVHYPPAPAHDHLQDFHNHLSMQAGAYQNGTWVVGVAKAGREEGCDLIGGSCIIAPTGEIAAQCVTLGDEVIVAECDLDRCREIQDNIFNFAEHRQPDQYGLLVETTP